MAGARAQTKEPFFANVNALNITFDSGALPVFQGRNVIAATDHDQSGGRTLARLPAIGRARKFPPTRRVVKSTDVSFTLMSLHQEITRADPISMISF